MSAPVFERFDAVMCLIHGMTEADHEGLPGEWCFAPMRGVYLGPLCICEHCVEKSA